MEASHIMSMNDGARLTIERYLAAYRAILRGPGHDPDTVVMHDWMAVLDGTFLHLRGSVDDHPTLGTRYITTSALAYLSADGRSARTLSRWYKLQEPSWMPMLAGPDGDSIVACRFSDGGLGLPLDFARRVMAERPRQLAIIARDQALDAQAAEFEQIDRAWPLDNGGN